MQLLTKQIRNDLDRNMKLPEEDRKPVVKFFAPWGSETDRKCLAFATQVMAHRS